MCLFPRISRVHNLGRSDKTLERGQHANRLLRHAKVGTTWPFSLCQAGAYRKGLALPLGQVEPR